MLDVGCQCGTRFKLADEWAGKQVKCPACGTVFTIASCAAAPDPPPPLPAKAIALAPPMAPALVKTAAPAPVAATPRAVNAPAAVTPSPDALLTTFARLRPMINRVVRGRAAKWAAVAAGAIVMVVAGGLVASWSNRTGDFEPPPPLNSADSLDGAASSDPLSEQQPPPESVEQIASNVHETAASAVSASLDAWGEVATRPATSASNDPDSAADPVTRAAAADGPTIEPRARPATRPHIRRGKQTSGVSGVSRNFDDLHCQLIQTQHSARVPAAASIIEVDGDRLPIANPSALTASRASLVFLPRGEHAVRFRPNESLISVSVADDLLDIYWQMRDFFNAGNKIDEAELLSRSARALDSHSAPMLLNLMGSAHASKEEWPAAERKFRRSLRINPCFSPAHLNLAWCLERRGQKQEAARELRLAAIFNVGNVFGLASPMYEFSRKLGVDLGSGEPIVFDSAWYLAAEAASLSDEDRRITAFLIAVSKYAQAETQRAKILNNLGVHFADSGRAEVALDHFRGALAVLKQAGPERFALAREVLTHMSDACRAAGLEEAEEYERMRELVSP